MKRAQYPIEQLKDFLKNDGLDKLFYLMKRNKIEEMICGLNDYSSDVIKVSKDGTIGKERIEFREVEQQNNRLMNVGAIGIGNMPQYIEVKNYEFIKGSEFVDELKTANELLGFSRRIKGQIENLLFLEQQMLDSIQDIKKLKTNVEGRILILEKLTPSRNS